MQHVSNLITMTPGQQLAVSERPENAPQEWRGASPNDPAWDFWERMTEMYGHKWSSSYGEEPNEAWCGLLASLNKTQVRHGLNQLLNSADPWPPTAIQFRNLCIGHDPDAWERQCHKVIDTSPKLENLTAKQRRCAEGLESLRKLREEVGL